MTKMNLFVLISALIAFTFGSSQIPIRKIKVMASITKPFVYKEKQLLKGFEIEIIKNFANNMRLNPIYALNWSIVCNRNHILTNQLFFFPFFHLEVSIYSLALSKKI